MNVQRFTTFPGWPTIEQLEGVSILDLTPPGSIVGSGTTVAAVVGEFLKGPNNLPTEVTSSADLADIFGTWSPYSNPGGARPAPGNPGSLPLDGNGFLAIRGRPFARLVLVRVKDDVATVSLKVKFTPGAGGAAPQAQDIVIPAGIRLTDADASDIVATIEDINIRATDFAAGTGDDSGKMVFTKSGVKVRRVLGSATTENLFDRVASPEATAVLPDGYDALDCTASSEVTDINEAAMLGYYQDAIDSLASDSYPANAVSVVACARHFDGANGTTLMSYLKQHAIDVAAKGPGRVACIAPPVGTGKATVLGSGDLSVENTGRSDRAIYCWPASYQYIRELPAAAISASSNGYIDWPSDVEMAALLTRLPPHEDPGQATTYLANVQGQETAIQAAPLSAADYIALKAAGVATLRIDRDFGAIFQSGCTSVDPSTYPSLVDISRRRMADFIQDSIANRCKAFLKTLNTAAKRTAIRGEVEAFLETLLSRNNPALQVIEAYEVDEVNGNTPELLAQGVFVLIVRVRLCSSMKYIVLMTEVGQTVQIQTTL